MTLNLALYARGAMYYVSHTVSPLVIVTMHLHYMHVRACMHT